MKKTAVIALFFMLMAISAFCYQSGNTYAIPRGRVNTYNTPYQSYNNHSTYNAIKHSVKKTVHKVRRTTVKTVRKVRTATARGIHNVQKVTNRVFRKIKKIVTPKYRYRYKRSYRPTKRKPMITPG